MTPEVEKNLKYNKDSFKNAGFGNSYDSAIEAGYREGKKEIALEPAKKAYGENSLMVWEPKMTEGKTPGRYNFNGYQATLLQEGKEPVSQFIKNFKMTGLTLEQSAFHLVGATILHSDWDNKENERKMVFSRLDLSHPVAPGENHPVIVVNAKELEMGRLLSKEDIVASQDEKEKILAKLQTGEPIQVTTRVTVQGGAVQYPKAILQLHLVDDKSMAMRVMDTDGTFLRVQAIPVNSQDIQKTYGLVVGNESDKKLPDNLLKLLEQNRNQNQSRVSTGKSLA